MVDVLAHRGASAYRPENTLEAYALAVEMGADGIEFDVRRSQDGWLVIHHDAELPDGRVISATPREALPSSVPTLGDTLDACRGVLAQIEIKPGASPSDSRELAEGVVATLRERREAGIGDDVLISSFDLLIVDRVRESEPESATAWLTFEGEPQRLLDTCARHGHGAIHPHWSQVDADFMARAREAGLRVNVWTVDEEEEIRRLAGLGVDAIVTNRPDTTRRVLEARPD